MNILKDLKRNFEDGGMEIKLLFVNIGVFLVVLVMQLLIEALQSINSPPFELVKWLAVPAALGELVYKPWTLLTYNFLHTDLFHILFNMMGLYWFGKLFIIFHKRNTLLPVYLLGGLSGGLLYVIMFNLIPSLSIIPSYALGASASVMAIVFAVATLKPEYEVVLMFFGAVRLKYIALAAIVIDVISIFMSSNIGGHIAHLGGALFGYIFTMQMRQGKDITLWLSTFISNITKPRKKPVMKVTYSHGKPTQNDREYNASKHEQNLELDKILDKINKSGYNSLTAEEKEFLFRISDRQ